jgi:hypothetical protein
LEKIFYSDPILTIKVKAKPIEELDQHNLTPNKLYHVFSIEYEDYRIVSDRGGPVLFPKFLFDVVDPHIPEDWVVEADRDEDDVVYFGPAEFAKPGFYEDWHDRVKSARDQFAQYIKINSIEVEGLDK